MECHVTERKLLPTCLWGCQCHGGRWGNSCRPSREKKKKERRKERKGEKKTVDSHLCQLLRGDIFWKEHKTKQLAAMSPNPLLCNRPRQTPRMLTYKFLPPPRFEGLITGKRPFPFLFFLLSSKPLHASFVFAKRLCICVAID